MNNYFKSAFGFLQKVGKSLMLPVSVLPVAGLFLGIGSAHFSVLPETLSNMMASSGDVIFGSLPLLFAVGVTLGFTNNDGVAAMASMLGYSVLVASMGVMAKVLGIDTINTGVAGGIFIGAIAAVLYNRYYKIQLPSYLGFFGGKRFIPIVTSMAAIVAGVVLAYVWPPIGGLIKSFSHWAASENPRLAFTLYGIGERALIPFGLHHIWNAPFFFETGSFVDPATGQTITGEIARYLHGDPTAGNLAGGYLFKMWGLPAAAIAMWHSAKPENKALVGGIMISAALTSFVTGITEPIEFSFLFVAPVLYAVHALLSGLAFFVCIALGIKHGTTFSHGLIDFIVLFPKSTNALYLLVLGPIWAGVYYGVFRYVIAKFDLKTPGRDADVTVTGRFGGARNLLVESLVAAFGGADNIKNLDACITRLRVQLNDMSLLKEDVFKQSGATGLLKAGNGVQVIFGTRSENIKTQMEEYLRGTLSNAELEAAHQTQSVSKTTGLKAQDTSWLPLLGGASNILEADLVAVSRVRVLVKDKNQVQMDRLRNKANEKDMTVHIYAGNAVHIIAGEQSQQMLANLTN
ncbi:MAG: PTS glucose transporter subunit IIBC [Pseudobdellovibrio sp.]